MAGYNDYRNPGSATAGQAVDSGSIPSDTANDTYAFTVNPGAYSGDHAASNLSAALTRAQWLDWKKRFAPLGEQLAQDIHSGARLHQVLNGVNSSINKGFGQAEAANKRRLSRYGVQLTGQDKQAADTGFGLRKDAAAAAARNWARKAVEEGNRELLGGVQ